MSEHVLDDALIDLIHNGSYDVAQIYGVYSLKHTNIFNPNTTRLIYSVNMSHSTFHSNRRQKT